MARLPARWRRRCGTGRPPMPARPRRSLPWALCSPVARACQSASTTRRDGSRQAAEQGHVAAQFNIAVFYLNGTGVERDTGQGGSVVCPRRRAGHGDGADQTRPALPRRGGRAAGSSSGGRRGCGVPPKPATPKPRRCWRPSTCKASRSSATRPMAEQLLRRAADRGYGPALLQLGHYYAEDRGAGTNQPEAIRCYRAAAEAGVVAAQWIVAHNSLAGAWGPRDAAKRRHRGSAGRPRPGMPAPSSSSASCTAPERVSRAIWKRGRHGIAGRPSRASASRNTTSRS